MRFLNLFKSNKKEPWQIAAGRFCVENSESGFTIAELKEFIHSRYKVHDSHVVNFFIETIQHPSGRQFNRENVKERWTPPLELVSTITDYDELVEARKNAKQAFWLSILAILISAGSLIISVVKN